MKYFTYREIANITQQTVFTVVGRIKRTKIQSKGDLVTTRTQKLFDLQEYLSKTNSKVVHDFKNKKVKKVPILEISEKLRHKDTYLNNKQLKYWTSIDWDKYYDITRSN